ncbi:MAG TPA: T9SS type A sorting domain-containing protein, partial [Phaeodactylibacter sp.]|nr:T9SS type A sorting domain-containing protein [Phaeodactylibacter sp.]
QILLTQKGNDFKINTSAWASGMYFVEITNEESGEVVKRKIVVQQ